MTSQLFPILDIPGDCVSNDDFAGEMLDCYCGFSFRLRALFIIYCKEGSVHASINFREQTITQGKFALLLSNSTIRLMEIADGTRLSIIGISAEVIESCNILQMFSSVTDIIAQTPVVTLSGEEVGLLKCAISMIRQSQRQQSAIVRNQLVINTVGSIATIVLPLYRNLSVYHRSSASSRADELMHQFYSFVMKYYTSEHRVCFYADQLKVSTPYLCSVVSKQTGKTALQIINKAIITDAKAQLRMDNQPIKTIALSLGFDNTAFFSKFFRNHAGMSPQEYRRAELDTPAEASRQQATDALY